MKLLSDERDNLLSEKERLSNENESLKATITQSHVEIENLKARLGISTYVISPLKEVRSWFSIFSGFIHFIALTFLLSDHPHMS